METICSDFLVPGSSTLITNFPDQFSLLPGLREPANHPASIAFIDARVNDPIALIAGLEADLYVLLNAETDGISQISEILSHQQGLTRVDIVSHGDSGVLQLGSGSISSAELSSYSGLLSDWQSHLSDDADILIYGCNVASGGSGQAFANQLSALTGADVAASDNLTGSSSRGGDWVLEYATGPIEQANIVSASLLNSYDGTLQTLFTSQTPAQLKTDGNGADWELGTRFSSGEPGLVNAIRYYKAPGETGVHTGKIWASNGSLLASVAFTNESASGWQQQVLPTPLLIEPNATYVVSVNANSFYAITPEGFNSTIANGSLIAKVGAGVYTDTIGAFPSQAWNNSNYFRDVDFTPLSANIPSATIPAPVGTGAGLLGEYFDNIDFTNSKLTRTDSAVNFNWASGSPASAVGADTFSVRWTGQVQPRYSETFTFYTTADDGIRLWVDGKQIINNFVDQAPTERSGSITLEAGKKYDIRVEYYENGGGAVAQLAWSSPTQAKQIIPQSQLYSPAPPPSTTTPTSTNPAPVGTGAGLLGEYFDNIDFTNSKFTRTDSAVNFNWASGSPASAVGADTFSVRWTGQVQPRYSETYTFYTTADDGIRLWVDGKQIINNFVDQAPTERSGSITLEAGKKYDIRVEYYENRGGAVAQLAWSSPREAKQIIPQSQLYSPAPPPSTTPTNSLGSLSLTGTPTQGQILTAQVADADGLPATINYQWQQKTISGTTWSAITGATARTLTLQQAQVGQQVRALSSYADLRGANETLTSAPTAAAVLNVNDPGIVSITGTSTQGQILTATVADADGLPATINYQWQQSSNGTTWSTLTGATARTLTLQQAQVGERVRATVSYRDLLGADETLTTTPSAAVLQGQIITAPATSDPTWSAGRDSSGRLIVNSGTLGNITFQSEYRGSYPREADFSGPTPVDRVAYDWNMDGYNGQPLGSYRNGGGAYANADLAHPAWKDGAFRNVLIKNWNIKNAYKTISGPHVDVTQIYDSVGWGGFFVAQDSTFKNSDDGIVQWQFGYNGNSLPAYQGKAQSDFGGVVVQGVTLNQEAAFVADATARVSLNGEPTVYQGNYVGSWDPGVGWFINYQTNGWPITLQQRWEKVIVVGNLPDFSFRSGDAYAFSVATTPTAGQPSAFGGRVFYYPTIEAALAAGHEEPPFVRLSSSGWGNPQANAPGAREWNPPVGW